MVGLNEHSAAYTQLVETGPPDTSPQPAAKRLGQFVRDRRTQLQLTQAQFAARAGINPVTVSSLENGRQGPPRGGTAVRIEDALKLRHGAIRHVLEGGDPAAYVNDPPSATEISVDLARDILAAVNGLRHEFPTKPELAKSMITMLEQTEGKLTQLVEQGFTREVLPVLMDINALHRELAAELEQPPAD